MPDKGQKSSGSASDPSDAPPQSETASMFGARIRASRRKSGLRRTFAFLLKTGAVTALFTASAAAGLVLHLDTREARGVGRSVLNRLLGDTFRGTWQVGEIEHLSLDGARVHDATFFDPSGREILHAEGIEATISTKRLVETLLSSKGPLEILLPIAHIERARVTLVPEAGPVPSMASAFQARRPGPPSGVPGRPVSFRIESILIDQAEVHGDVSVPLAGRLEALAGTISVRTDDKLALDVERTHLVVDELFPQRIDASADYHLEVDLASLARAARDGVDAPSAVRMHSDVSGALGIIPFEGGMELVGRTLAARAFVTRVSPDAVRSLLPWSPLLAPATCAVTVSGELPTLDIDADVTLTDPQYGTSTVHATGSLEPGALALSSPELDPSELRIAVDFETTQLDPRVFAPDAPAAKIDAAGSVFISAEANRPLRLGLEVATDPTTLFGQHVPAIDAVADVVADELMISATVHEDGAPLDARVHVADGRVAFSVEGNAEDLARMTRLDGKLAGAARVRVDGTFEDGKLVADVDGGGTGLVASIPTDAGAEPISATTAKIRAHLEGKPDALEIDADVVASGVGAIDQNLDQVHVHASGPLLEPVIVANLSDEETGTGTAQATLSLKEKRARDVTFDVERNGERVKGSIVAVGPPASKSGASSGFSVEGLTVDGGTLGRVKSTLRVDGGDLSGDLSAQGIDLERVARLVGVDSPVTGVANVELHLGSGPHGRRGTLELELQGNAARGTIRVRRSGGGLSILRTSSPNKASLLDYLDMFRGVAARVSARVDGNVVDATGFVRIVDHASGAEQHAAKKSGSTLCDGPVAEVRFSDGHAELRGDLVDPSAWLGATGSVDVVLDSWELGCIAERLPAKLRDDLPHVDGLLAGRFKLERARDAPYPSIERFIAFTHRLRVDDVTEGGAAWASRDLDVVVSASLDGRTGQTELGVELHDDKLLARLDASATLALARLLRGDRDSAAAFRETAFDARLSVQRRALATLVSLPSPIGELFDRTRGAGELVVVAGGTFGRPGLSAKLALSSLVAGDLVPAAASIAPTADVSATFTYDPATSQAALRANLSEVDKSTPFATLTADVSVKVDDLFDALSERGAVPELDRTTKLRGARDPLSRTSNRPARDLPWKGSATLEVTDMPLAVLPSLGALGVEGKLSHAVVHLDGLHESPSLRIEDLRLDGVRIEDSELAMTGGGSIPTAEGNATSEGKLRLDVVDGHGGKAALAATMRFHWRDGFIPEPDEHGEGYFGLEADDFALATFYPAVAGPISRLEGRVSGHAVVRWSDLSKLESGSIERADLRLSDVVLYIPQLGQELSEGTAEVSLDAPSDDDRKENPAVATDPLTRKLTLSGVSARGASGRVGGDAWVLMQGLKPRSARASLTIDEKEALPVTLEGVPLGTVSGTFTVRTPDLSAPRRLVLQAEVPKARFELPASSSRNVQGLDAAPGVVVVTNGASRDPRASITRPKTDEAAKRDIEIDVSLGAVEVTSSSIELVLGTDDPLKITLGDRVVGLGDVILRRGSLELNKKTFELDEGVVALREEELGNPWVNLSAHYDAPDDTRVIVDYVGLLSPITEDKIHFRSDPPQTKEQIVALLLFGNGEATAANLAGNLGTSLVSGIVNDLLSTSALGEYLAVNVGASDSGGGYVAAQIRFSDELKVGGSYADDTGRTDKKGVAGTQCGDLYFDYRFAPNWSLRGSGAYCGAEAATDTTDAFTLGLDVIWQFRY
ncbi:MAG: translocation/assembly module TamB domain-containing protein [Polyangiaceae bacterium]